MAWHGATTDHVNYHGHVNYPGHDDSIRVSTLSPEGGV